MKLSRSIVAAVVFFLFCWAPISVLQLLEVYRAFDNQSFKNAFLISIWCAMAQISNSSLSPVIYAFLNPELRNNLLKHCYFCYSHRMSTIGLQHCPLGRVEPVIWHGQITAENHQNIKFSAYVPSACLFLELLRRDWVQRATSDKRKALRDWDTPLFWLRTSGVCHKLQILTSLCTHCMSTFWLGSADQVGTTGAQWEWPVITVKRRGPGGTKEQERNKF